MPYCHLSGTRTKRTSEARPRLFFLFLTSDPSMISSSTSTTASGARCPALSSTLARVSSSRARARDSALGHDARDVKTLLSLAERALAELASSSFTSRPVRAFSGSGLSTQLWPVSSATPASLQRVTRRLEDDSDTPDNPQSLQTPVASDRDAATRTQRSASGEDASSRRPRRAQVACASSALEEVGDERDLVVQIHVARARLTCSKSGDEHKAVTSPLPRGRARSSSVWRSPYRFKSHSLENPEMSTRP
ncbi:hypothetical protein EXIGLDRAFT_829822 [Exidia glandulosa HHB12029]|uniref:Uncharacterized protein n=1 Tax=Exidia glandulosa HHB12029 TaxID=1314781 RepID=A0A165PB51_EXIGL|nr:hypothetical protein EXIGLDRAFT_829822 [Exidia glandulosa HHB12029]